MKKTLKILAAAGIMTVAMGMTAFAGQWKQDTTGWWYDYGNGTWPASSWQWVDGNSDGIAECYYFDQYGYCLMNTTTPDGYQVDGNGAWVVNGAVQTRNTAGTPVNGSQENATAQDEVDYSAPKARLDDMTPDVYDNVTFNLQDEFTSGGESWNGSAVYQVAWATNWNAYADYYLGGQYSLLTMKVVPYAETFWNGKDAGIVMTVYDEQTGERIPNDLGHLGIKITYNGSLDGTDSDTGYHDPSDIIYHDPIDKGRYGIRLSYNYVRADGRVIYHDSASFTIEII